MDSDNSFMGKAVSFFRGERHTAPWALVMQATAREDPNRLVQILTGAILGCGGWLLSRGTSDTGAVSMLFEFERGACLDIYSVLVASGLELTQRGHFHFTELCRCTRLGLDAHRREIASIDLEVQTLADESMNEVSAPLHG